MGQFSLVTGAGTKCYINGLLVGEVFSINYRSATNRRPIMGLDSGEPYELASTTTKVSGTIGLYRKTGLGGLEGYGIVSDFENAPRELYVSIRVVSRQTGEAIFECNNAAITDQSWSVAAREIMKGSFSFEGISWRNEIKGH